MSSRSRLRRTGDPALYSHSTIHCVSVFFRWFSHLCASGHITVLNPTTAALAASKCNTVGCKPYHKIFASEGMFTCTPLRSSLACWPWCRSEHEEPTCNGADQGGAVKWDCGHAHCEEQMWQCQTCESPPFHLPTTMENLTVCFW